MPYYQVELFRTVHDQATATVIANNAQEAHILAGQQVDDLDWHFEDENITFGSTLQVPPSGYTSMASILAQNNVSNETSSYTPLVAR